MAKPNFGGSEFAALVIRKATSFLSMATGTDPGRSTFQYAAALVIRSDSTSTKGSSLSERIGTGFLFQLSRGSGACGGHETPKTDGSTVKLSTTDHCEDMVRLRTSAPLKRHVRAEVCQNSASMSRNDCEAMVSRVSRNCPETDTRSARWWPWDLPSGGHLRCCCSEDWPSRRDWPGADSSRLTCQVLAESDACLAGRLSR